MVLYAAVDLSLSSMYESMSMADLMQDAQYWTKLMHNAETSRLQRHVVPVMTCCTCHARETSGLRTIQREVQLAILTTYHCDLHALHQHPLLAAAIMHCNRYRLKE